MHCKVVSLIVLGYGNTPAVSPLGPVGFVGLGAGKLPWMQESSAGTTSRDVLPTVGMSQDLLWWPQQMKCCCSGFTCSLHGSHVNNQSHFFFGNAAGQREMINSKASCLLQGCPCSVTSQVLVSPRQQVLSPAWSWALVSAAPAQLSSHLCG